MIRGGEIAVVVWIFASEIISITSGFDEVVRMLLPQPS
jgi:hypothetical protein